MTENQLTTLEKEGLVVKTPAHTDWGPYARTYNRRVPAVPSMVILPNNIQQLSQAVSHAAQFGMPIQARSGGHSYASHSNGGINGAVVIDLRNLQDIVLDEHGIVRVGGGVRIGKLAVAIFKQGERALAHGTCPVVGIGGHFTHGGYGLSSRAWGLAIDQVVALDVVMACGKVVKASEHENKELFTAMRGAADSFGIVANFYLRTQPAPKSILKWTVDVPQAVSTVELAVEAFQHVQNFAQDASVVDRKLGFVIYIAHDRFSVEGTYLGDLKTFTSTVLPALVRGFPQRSTEVSIKQVDWLSSLQMWAGGVDLEGSPNDIESHAFFSKSAAVSHPGLSRDSLKSYFQYIIREGWKAPVHYFIGIQLYGGADSQISANTADDAFAHRDTMWMIQNYGYVDDIPNAEFPKKGLQFVEGLHESLGAGHGAYNNYTDPSLAAQEAQKLYYGDKLAMLKKLKRKLDPNNVFSHPQSIRAEE
ncbi:Glucooligosaccharide oxidase [Xylaria nigripes]|nr:Glucooligosaccharide oxidase [Xylaria nigripes]